MIKTGLNVCICDILPTDITKCAVDQFKAFITSHNYLVQIGNAPHDEGLLQVESNYVKY